jgi:MFS family permease
MLGLLRRRPRFRRLWVATSLSLVGDWLSFVAVSMLALDRGGGALSLAIVLAVHALPHALLTPLAGVVADRFDRRRVLVLAPLFQAALTLLMAYFAARGQVVPVQALLLARSAATAFVVPAETAALRHTVETEELGAANALVSGTWSLTFVLGMALGGAIAVLGPAPAILLDALSFVLAAALLSGLPAMRPEGREGAGAAAGLGALLGAVPGEMRAAFGYALGQPSLFRAVFSKAPVAIAGGAGWVVLNLVAGRSTAFGAGALTLGIVQAVRGAGTGLGPLAAASLRPGSRAALLAPHVAVVVALAGIALFPLAEPAPALLLGTTLVWGMGSGANWVLSSAALQTLAPDRVIGRLSSLDDLTTTAAMVAGAFVGGAVCEGGLGAGAAAAVGALLGLAGWLALATRGDGASATRVDETEPAAR